MSIANDVIYQSVDSKVESFGDGNLYDLIADELHYQIRFQDGAVQKVGGRNGWQNEELLAVLINRMNYLQGKFPCRENAIVITKLEEALLWLEKRTSSRQKQGVEGHDLPHKS